MFDFFTSKKTTIGLEISDRSIKVIELEKTGDNYNILALREVIYGEGVVENGRIASEERLEKYIKKAVEIFKNDELKKNAVVFGFPESQVFTAILNFQLSSSSVDEKIKEELANTMPIESDYLAYSFNVIKREEDNCKVFVQAVNKEVIFEWQHFFNKIGLNINYYDIELMAAYRGIFGKIIGKTVCVIDIGAVDTNIGMYKESLVYSNTFFVAGEFLTKKLAVENHIDFQKAEEIKKKIDISADKSQNSLIIKKGLDEIAEKIRLAIKYWEEENKEPPENIYLIGGTANLKGIVHFLEKKLEKEIKRGYSEAVKSGKIGLAFIQCLGLALRPMDSDWEKNVMAIPTFNLNKLNSIINRNSLNIKEMKDQINNLNINIKEESKTAKKSSFFGLF